MIPFCHQGPSPCFHLGKHLETAHPNTFFLLLSGPNEEFGIRLANRPFLALRGRYGYVGTSSEHDLLQGAELGAHFVSRADSDQVSWLTAWWGP